MVTFADSGGIGLGLLMLGIRLVLPLGLLGACIAVPIAAIAARLLGVSDGQPDVAEDPVEIG